LVGKHYCFPTHYFNKKKMALSSLLPPSRVRKMGLPETIFQPHSQMTEILVAIFLHFLTKQTNNHLNHTQNPQNPTTKTIGKKKEKENPNPCLPNKAIRVQIHWRRTTKSCSLVEPHHVVRQSLLENQLCLIGNRISFVNPREIRSLFRRRRPNGDPPEIQRLCSPFRLIGASNIEDGVGVLLGLEEGERRSCLLLGGERSGGIWGED
jgi:hypothetical protein